MQSFNGNMISREETIGREKLPMDEAIKRHCAEIERCNQRGERMLSVLDLLDAKTLDLDLAAYLMARISNGASFMVGANPGGAGKTTVMCALLNLVPPDRVLLAATPEAVRQGTAHPHCFICHEVGSGHYFAYLWGRDLQAYCSLSEFGHILASNLHADDLEEAYEQMCLDNGVPKAHFQSFHLMLFLQVSGVYPERRRRIATIYSSDGQTPHKLVFDDAQTNFTSDADPEWQAECRAFLQQAAQESGRTIEEFRERVVAFLVSKQHPEGKEV